MKKLAQRSLALLASLAAMALALLGGERRAEAANWYDGAPSRVGHVCNNFIAQTNEDLIWTYVGFQDVDTATGPRLPQTGEVYYVRVVMAGLGCSGAWAHPELALPAGTSLAISAANPIRCFSERFGRGEARQPLTAAGGCPTQALPGVYPGAPAGRFYAFPPQGQPYWPLPPGVSMTVEVPVQSTRVMSGIATNDYVVAAVNILDNNPGGGNPPWDGGGSGAGLPPAPWQGVFVTRAGAPRSPYVSYADTNGAATTTTATTDVTVHNFDCVANADVRTDILPVVTTPDATAFVDAQCTAGCCTKPCIQDFITYRFRWSGMTPDREYKWRAFLQNLSIAPGCTRDLADAQANATSPQWAYLRTQSTTPKPGGYVLFLQAEGGTLVADPAPPKGATRYAPGTKVRVSALPAPGKQLASVKVDGKVASGDLVLTMNEDHAIAARFEDGAAAPDGGAPSDDAASPPPAGSGGGSTGGGCATSPRDGRGLPSLLVAIGLTVAVLARRRRRASAYRRRADI